MRAHFWQYITNEEGQPIEGAYISIYLTGTTTPAAVYTSESGGSAVTESPQIESDENGFFQFWIADYTDTYGYDAGQKYTIAWEKEGVITAGSIDNVEIAVPTQEVDETSTNTLKNKLVSNNQAKVWTAKANMATITVYPAGTGGGVPEWATESYGIYYDFIHNLGNGYPIVVVYNMDVTPATSVTSFLRYSSTTLTRVVVSEEHECTITAVG